MEKARGKGRKGQMNKKPDAGIIHKEDGGLVYGSIKDNGTIIYFCDKCNKMWIGKYSTENEAIKKDEKEALREVSGQKDELLLKMLQEYQTPNHKKIKPSDFKK